MTKANTSQILMTKKAVKEAIAKFSKPAGTQSEAAAFLETAPKSDHQYKMALDILEAMAKLKMNFNGIKVPLEGVIAELKMPAYFSAGESDANKTRVKVFNILRVIGTPEATQHMVNVFSNIPDKEVRQELWAEIHAEESEASIRQTAYLAAKLDYSFHDKKRISRDELNKYQRQQHKRLFAVGSDQTHPQQKIAYGIILGQAKVLSPDALKYIANFGTRQSYKDTKEILSRLCSESNENYWRGESLETYTLTASSKVAYHIYRNIALKSKDIGMMSFAMSFLTRNLNSDDDVPHLKRLRSQIDVEFTRLEQGQATNKKGAEGDESKYAGAAEHYVYTDAPRAMRMLAKCRKLREGYVEQKLAEYGKEHSQHSLSIELMLDFGTPQALKQALFMMLTDFANNSEDQQVAQPLKMLAIAKIGALSRADFDGFHFPEYFQAFAQVRKFANDETIEAFLSLLISKNNSRSLKMAYDVLTTKDDHAVDVGANKEGDDLYLSFVPCRHKARWAMERLMELPKPNSDTFRTIRRIANRFKGELIQKASDYFTKDGSNAAIEQIRRLDGKVDVIAVLKALPKEQAITELTKVFNQNAIGSLNALLDLRDQEVVLRPDKVADYDVAIVGGVKRITESDNLLKLIRDGQSDELKALFDRMANTNIVDARKKFEAAINVVVCEDALQAAQAAMNKVTVILPEVKVA